MSNNKTLSAIELRGLLKNPPNECIKESYGKYTILVEGYTFEDKHLILDGTIAIDLPITFSQCTFKSDNFLFIDGLVCNESLTFDSCTISDQIYFNSGTFKKEVLIKYTHVGLVHLGHCSFGKVSISGYDIGQIWTSGSTFESLHIGEHLIGDNIQSLVIFAKENETGDIFVNDQGFSDISLYGSNKGREINFSRVRCNNVSIINFKNEGSLNFYGLEPKDLNSDKKYFQIIDSNLDKVQFYRASFSDYHELIIIDSFITDTLFIGCNWTNNIRSLHGPGYGYFERSLDTRRKIKPTEVIAIKEAYRQLKISMSNHSDKIQEHKFYSEELNFHNRSLSWKKPWTNQFWDKLILIFSRTFSDYGQSFIKPLVWLFVGHYILFSTAMLLNGFLPLRVSFVEPTFAGFEHSFEKYFIYINPLRRTEVSLSGYLIMLDLTMRIWSSYMIYNIIRSSRRFIS